MASNPTAKTMNFRFDTIPICTADILVLYVSQAKIRAWSGEGYVSSGVDIGSIANGETFGLVSGGLQLVLELELVSGWLPAHH